MKVIKFNEHNLKENEIDEIVTRVKVFLINEKNEVLVATSNGGCQLPGGHIEKNENLIDGIIREVQEETGIQLEKNEIKKSFYEIKHYTKNYKNLSKNRISRVIYYLVKTNKLPNLSKINLTESEQIYNFSVSFVPLKDFSDYVKSFINNTQKEINKIIAQEMLLAYEELLNISK